MSATAIQKFVRGIVQVVGNYHVPTTPRDQNELRQWYLQVRPHLHAVSSLLSLPVSDSCCQHSYIVVPTNHRFLLDGGKFMKKHGKVATVGKHH